MTPRTAAIATTTAMLLATAASQAQATFPGQNGRIAYTDPTGRIHTISPDGTGDRLLTEGTDPEWSPDGSMLLFQSQGETYSIKADGTGKTLLPHIPGGRPQLGPGTTAIATGDGEKVNVKGRALNESGFASIGDWGVNGLVAYTLQDGGLEAGSPTGATLRLPVPEGYRQRDAQWAPDAKSVLYAQELDPSNLCYQDPTCPAPSEGIMRQDLDGRITAVRPGVLYYPVPSPDGTRLAYGLPDGTIAVDGKVIARGTDPDWQPLPKLPPAGGPDANPAKTTTVQVPVPGPERVVYRQAQAPACVIPERKRRLLTLRLRVLRAIGRGATSYVRVDLDTGRATVLRPEAAGVRISGRVIR